jgi:aryl-alcohol dehydrogenase (NADP+)
MTYGSPAWRPWVLNEETSRSFIIEAWERGINFFDTADMYSLGASEEILGRILKEIAPRREVVVATKVYHPMSDKPNERGLSRKHIRESIDASLKRLRMDYVDLYQIHRFDYHTPVEETLEALDEVVRAGKALYLGASSMWAWQMAQMLGKAEKNGWHRFVSMQNHYNLIYREEEREMIPLCLAEGIGILPWSPLARGLLAGNRGEGTSGPTRRAETDPLSREFYGEGAEMTIREKLAEISQRRGKAPVQVALAWLLSRPGVTAPVVGVSKPGQLAELLGALEIKLTAEETAQLTEPYLPRKVQGHE